jgi:hypothetical protein
MNWFKTNANLAIQYYIICKDYEIVKNKFFKKLICVKEIKESWESKIFYFNIDFSKLIRKKCVEDVVII